VRGHDDQVTAFRPCGIDDPLIGDAHAPRGPFRRRRLPLPLRARQFSRPAFAHLLVNAGRVEVVIVTNENSTIDPTYDVNDASDGP
jgi:hypothetical protein